MQGFSARRARTVHRTLLEHAQIDEAFVFLFNAHVTGLLGPKMSATKTENPMHSLIQTDSRLSESVSESRSSKLLSGEAEIARAWLKNRSPEHTHLHVSYRYANSDDFMERADLDITTD